MAGKKTDITDKQLRSFGLTVGGAFIVLGGLLLWWGHSNAAEILGTLGVLLSSLGPLWPKILYYPYRGWMCFAFALAWFNTRLILSLVFYLLITPVGLLLRLLGKRPLDLRWEPDRESYWIRREKAPFDPKRYEKHF